MIEESVFRPPRRLGVLVNSIGIVLLTLVGTYNLWKASGAEVGPDFLIHLLLSLASLALIPLLSYVTYALWRATYILERDGIRLQWGLRREEIPIDRVLRVGPVEDAGIKLPLPWLRWPGSVLGQRRLPDSSTVDFLAARSSQLMVISTPGRAFVISPNDPRGFMQAYRQFAELGSLTPLPARTIYANFLVARLWTDLTARYLLLAATALVLALVTWVSLAAPGRGSVTWGFTIPGASPEPQPSIRLLLLPVLNALFFALDFTFGLFLYSRDGQRHLAYLLWGSSVLTGALFLVGLILILV